MVHIQAPIRELIQFLLADAQDGEKTKENSAALKLEINFWMLTQDCRASGQHLQWNDNSKEKNMMPMWTSKTITPGERKCCVKTLKFLICPIRWFLPVSVIFVIFGRVNHGACLDTDLLEQIPNFLVDVLLKWKKKRKKTTKFPFKNKNYILKKLDLDLISLHMLSYTVLPLKKKAYHRSLIPLYNSQLCISIKRNCTAVV